MLTKKTCIKTCYFRPNPIITWFHNGVQIPSDSSDYEVNVFQPQRLTIRSASVDMTGTYRCEYQNRAGTASSEGDLVLAGNNNYMLLVYYKLILGLCYVCSETYRNLVLLTS